MRGFDSASNDLLPQSLERHCKLIAKTMALNERRRALMSGTGCLHDRQCSLLDPAGYQTGQKNRNTETFLFPRRCWFWFPGRCGFIGESQPTATRRVVSGLDY
jgi:hypothetical protein